jgi:hypothetical protein
MVMIQALGIFAVTSLLMSMPRWPIAQLDRPTIGSIGAVLMIAAGVLTPAQAYQAIDRQREDGRREPTGHDHRARGAAVLPGIRSYVGTPRGGESGADGRPPARALPPGPAEPEDRVAAARERRKLLLFVSDGGDWEDGLVAAAHKAQQQGVTIISVGLGGMLPTRIPRYDRDGVFEGYELQGDQTLTTALN